MRPRLSLLARPLWGVALVLVAGGVCAQDKSGLGPSAISLPGGPGSIEGLGDTFAPALNTGTARYSVPFKVPPGTAGRQPSLGITYDGGTGDGLLGLGWTLPLPSIRRRTSKGVPRYVDGPNGIDDNGDGVADDPAELDVYLDPSGEELIRGADDDYRAENESSFIRYRRRAAGGWEAQRPDGVRLFFGESAAARSTDPGTGRPFEWFVEREVDPDGNTIEYAYETAAGPENQGHVYPALIRYGAGPPPWQAYRVVRFTYEARTDWVEDCRAGFPIRTGRRLAAIAVGIHRPGSQGPDLDGDAAPDELVRRYRFTYGPSSRSLLTEVAVVGADGVSELPPARFTYTGRAAPALVDASTAYMGSSGGPPRGVQEAGTDLADLDGDGLPDLLRTLPYGGGHYAYLNRGESGSGTKVITWSGPVAVGGDPLAANVDLADSSGQPTQLVDLDGDGLVDLAYRTGLGDVYMFPGTGQVAWGSRTLMVPDPSESAPPSPFGTPGVRSADLDGDERMDVFQSVGAGLGFDYRVWMNLGGGRFAKSRTVTQAAGFDLSAVGVQVADMNGDRLPDVARIRPTGVQWTAGEGRGRFGPLRTSPLPDLVLSDVQVGHAVLRDVDGDGLADLVVERAQPGQLWYWPNGGNDTFGTVRKVVGLLAVGGSAEVRWADLNGNGTTDLVVSDPDNGLPLGALDVGALTGSVPKPFLLRTIDNGIGASTEITYGTTTSFRLADDAAGRPWPDRLPFPVEVVSAYVVDDGLGHRYRSEVTYHDGYYDPSEREFRGFRQVEVRRVGDAGAPDLVTTYTYDVGAADDALKGKILAFEQRGSGVFSRDTSQWRVNTLMTSADGDGRTVSFAFLAVRTRDLLEQGAGTPVALRWEYTYDDYGNRTRMVEFGRADPGWDDERVTTTTFTAAYPDGPALWLPNLPVEEQVADGGGNVLARTRTYYDGATSLGAVTAGHRTRVERQAAPGRWVPVERTDYDAYGNPLVQYGALHGIEPGHRIDLAYDAIFHTFPVRESIDVGDPVTGPLVYQATYDPRFGTPATTTDFNGVTTVYAQDVFGRLVSVTVPPQSAPAVEYTYGVLDPVTGGSVNWVEAAQADGSPGDGRRHLRTYYDGLGRRLQTRAESETVGSVDVVDAVTFNGRQLPGRKFLPYRQAGGLGFVAPDPTLPHTRLVYDALGRVVRSERAEVAGARAVQLTEYQPLTVVKRDPLQAEPSDPEYGAYRRIEMDGLVDADGGRVRVVEEVVRVDADGNPAAELQHWSTRYGYDALDRLVSVTDPLGNLRTFAYDGLDRVVQVGDPDGGFSTFDYDDEGHLTGRTDATGASVRYGRDGAGRKVWEDAVGVGAGPEVTYHYDRAPGPVALGDGTSGTQAFTRGRLAWVEDPSGSHHFSYDERGRLAWEVRAVTDPVAGTAVRYRTGFAYDASDRVASVTYPDGDEVTYRYHPSGTLAALEAGGRALATYAYRPSGQVVSSAYANGVQALRTYDERLRVTGLTVSDGAARGVLDYRYRYDPGDQLKGLEDRLPAGVLPAGDPARNALDMAYDGLRRLTAVTVDLGLPGQPQPLGSLVFRFDPIGNLLAKTSAIAHGGGHGSLTDPGTFSYGGAAGRSARSPRQPGDPPGPHAFTGVDNGAEHRAATYDAAGRVATVDGLGLTWDAWGRLRQVAGPGFRAEYRYDHQGRRAWKRVDPVGAAPAGPAGSRSTVYVNRYVEIRDGQPWKYAWAGGRRVARTTGMFSPTGPRTQRLVLAAGWNLVSLGVEPIGTLAWPSFVSAVYRWDGAGWVEAAVADPVHRGDVLWLECGEAGVVPVTGTWSAPQGPRTVGEGFFSTGSTAGAEVLALDPGAVLWAAPPGAGPWAAAGEGLARFPEGWPSLVAGGRGYYLRAPEGGAVLGARAAGILYLTTDHLGSAAVVTDEAGAVVERRTYYPFGATRHRWSDRVPATPYGFTGKEFDEESGFIDFGARAYLPELGRFLSPDPLVWVPQGQVGLSASSLGYGYARGRPYDFIDPDGRKEKAVLQVEGGGYFDNSTVWQLARESGLWSAKARPIRQAGGDVIIQDLDPKTGGWKNVAIIRGATERTFLEKAGLFVSNVTVGAMAGTFGAGALAGEAVGGAAGTATSLGVDAGVAGGGAALGDLIDYEYHTSYGVDFFRYDAESGTLFKKDFSDLAKEAVGHAVSAAGTSLLEGAAGKALGAGAGRLKANNLVAGGEDMAREVVGFAGENVSGPVGFTYGVAKELLSE